MKKNIFFLALIAIICSCTIAQQNQSNKPSKPDKRDKYVGEYKLLIYNDWWGEHEGVHWNNYTNSYDMEWYRNSRIDSIYTLVVSKEPYDTVSLRFSIVKPFDFERQERIRQENEEIKKRNEESICGKDEELREVPSPTFDDKRDVVQSYHGYVEGHKVFISDKKKGDDYEGSGYSEEITFDSVYLRNDTFYYKRQSYAEFYSKYKKTGWQTLVEHCVAVKDTLE